MLACNCLNVIIETEKNDFQKVNTESLELGEDESKDVFFKQEVLQLGKLVNISKAQTVLIVTRNVGSWIVHRCINCDIQTHAIHREKGASCVLVFSQLLRTESILKLKDSDIFSTVFNIIVNPNNIEFDDKLRDSYMPKEVRSTLKCLKEITSDVLRKEASAVEERIKEFTEQQYTELDNLKDRAYRDEQALIDVILSNATGKPKVPESSSASNNVVVMSSSSNTSLISSTSPNKTTGRPSLTFSTSPNQLINNNNNMRHTPKRQKSSPGSAHTNNSIDAEGLFDFEGTDDLEGQQSSDMEDCEDNEDTMRDDGGGIAIPRNRSYSSTSLAKSLPMNIPVFISQMNHNNDDVDEILPTEDNLDIAASMKALAKSIHGDAVFGDLPRPRFSTQI